jgi:hypothetical protein
MGKTGIAEATVEVWGGSRGMDRWCLGFLGGDVGR